MKYQFLKTAVLTTISLNTCSTRAQQGNNNDSPLLCTFFPHLCETEVPSTSPSYSAIPSADPTSTPTSSPSNSKAPSPIPSPSPSSSPSSNPSSNPTDEPSEQFSSEPSSEPTVLQSDAPSLTAYPSAAPTTTASSNPSFDPTSNPTVTAEPSAKPSLKPSPSPSSSPSMDPSSSPSTQPTLSHAPSSIPSTNPTDSPSANPIISPSQQPSTNPTDSPTTDPTSSPSLQPTDSPSQAPSDEPTESPSETPSDEPTYSHRPNLIMILTDEHNIRTLGCYRDILRGEQSHVWGENVEVLTPNIDRLASEGAIFSNFYTVAPLCTPSRASFMTGLYPPKTGGSRVNHGRMDDDMITFAQILRDQRGYDTGYFGKWHLNGDAKPGWGNDERKFGFTDTTYQFNRGHWKYLEMQSDNMNAYEYSAKNRFRETEEENYTTDFLFDRGIEFMEKAKIRNEPFAYVLSIPDPHAPQEVRAPYDTMFDDMYFNLPKTAKRAVNKNPAPPKWNYHEHMGIPLSDANSYLKDFEESEKWQTHLRQYFGMVKCIDDNVGKLLNYLTTEGIDEETIIVLTSDHGDLLGEHGKMNKGRPFRTSAGIPFLLRYPEKVPAGKHVKTAFSSVDFAPSILELMGVSNPGVEFDGITFANEVASQQQTTNYFRKRYIFDTNADAHWAAVYMRSMKLVVSRFDIPWLYDLNADPYEMTNFFNDPKYAEVAGTLLDDIHRAMWEYDMPLKDATRFMYWSKPACYDSDNRIQLDSVNYTCDDIGSNGKLKSLDIERCNEEALQQHCPQSCGTCCEDSQGPIWIDGNLRYCSDLQSMCDKGRIRRFCRQTCGECDGATDDGTDDGTDGATDNGTDDGTAGITPSGTDDGDDNIFA